MTLHPKTSAIAIVVLCVLFSCKKMDVPQTGNAPSTDPRGATAQSSYLLPSPFDLPIRVDPNFKWGVNGHPLVQPSYINSNSTGLQMSVLKELQAPYYRVDVQNLAENGTIQSTDLAHFNDLMSNAAANSVQVIPVK